jgi:hypothetical protein
MVNQPVVGIFVSNRRTYFERRTSYFVFGSGFPYRVLLWDRALLFQGGRQAMPKHIHQFVESYDGLVGFGLDRQTDEKTLICYLQKFSDDAVMDAIIKRLEDSELAEVFDLINRLLRRHFTETEYHRLFLKDD